MILCEAVSDAHQHVALRVQPVLYSISWSENTEMLLKSFMALLSAHEVLQTGCAPRILGGMRMHVMTVYRSEFTHPAWPNPFKFLQKGGVGSSMGCSLLPTSSQAWGSQRLGFCVQDMQP
jgi:hypothetical protein